MLEDPLSMMGECIVQTNRKNSLCKFLYDHVLLVGNGKELYGWSK